MCKPRSTHTKKKTNKQAIKTVTHYTALLKCRNNTPTVITQSDNRPLPSSKNPHFQNEARCTTFLVKMSSICMGMKYDFHIKGCAPTLVLKQRPGGTRTWPIAIQTYNQLANQNAPIKKRGKCFQRSRNWFLFIF